jgi:hypothetical protein
VTGTNDWSINDRRLRLGPHLFISFQRSGRLTEPSSDPPRSHGAAPLWEMDGATKRALDADVLVPVGEDEALWIGFEPADDRVAMAVRVGVEPAGGGTMIDATTDGRWTDKVTTSPQNYIVSPPQWALYGISDGKGRAWQFVRAAAAGRDDPTGVARLYVMCAPPRVMPALPPRSAPAPVLHTGESAPEQRDTSSSEGKDEGIVPQLIHADPYGVQHWDFGAAVAARVLFASPEEFERRSGLPRPGPLDSADTYQGRRLP